MSLRSVVDGDWPGDPPSGGVYGYSSPGGWEQVLTAVDGHVFVDGLDKLPDPAGGVISLLANVAYEFTNTVDLLGLRLELASGTVLLGTSSETAIIKSTGLDVSTPLISAAHGGPNPMQNIRIEGVGTAFDIDGLGGANAALDWMAVNLVNCGSAGSIRDISNLVINTSAWIDCGQLTLDGTIGTVSFFQVLWTVPSGSGKTAIRLESTCTISRRFRVSYSPMVIPVGCTGIDVVDKVSTFPGGETLSLRVVNFAGGGTYLAGADFDDVETLIESTRGLVNSTPSAHVFMTGNATATPVAATGTFYKVLGTTSQGTYSSKFTFSQNRATYNGGFSRFFRISASAAMKSGNNNDVRMRFAVNGVTLPDSNQRAVTGSAGRVESITTLGTVLLNPGDYIEIWVANDTSTSNITVTDMQMTASSIA